VTLGGEVEKKSMIRLAVKMARSVDGVVDVTDRLIYAGPLDGVVDVTDRLIYAVDDSRLPTAADLADN